MSFAFTSRPSRALRELSSAWFRLRGQPKRPIDMANFDTGTHLINRQRARNYELTMAVPLTTLPPLVKPLPSIGILRRSNRLISSLQRGLCSQIPNNIALYSSIFGENFAKKDWREKTPLLSLAALIV